MLIVSGKPMVAWSISHAQQAKGINQIVVSTDGTEIAQTGRAQGIEVIDRPVELAGDTATVAAATRHAVEYIEARDGQTFDPIVILYGNVPVRPANLIDRALEKLAQTGCDSVQSVCPIGKQHPLWARTLEGPDGDQLSTYQENSIDRRQDLPPAYALDGGVIVLTRSSLFSANSDDPHACLGNDRRAITTERGQVIDIDDEFDLQVAEALLTKPHESS